MAWPAPPKGNQRAAGAHKPSAKRVLWHHLEEYVTGDGLARYLAELQTADSETFMKHYVLILEFVRPRLQRQRIETTTSDTREIRLSFGHAAPPPRA